MQHVKHGLDAACVPRQNTAVMLSARLRPLAAFFIITVVLLTLVPLGIRPLFNLNEGLYAEIAREMMTHNLLLPRLDGLPYLEKPPLYYWLVIGGYRLFGVGRLAARLPSALAALGTLFVLYRFARSRMAAPIWPPLILFTSVGFYLMSQLAMFDMTFTLFHTITLLAFFAYMENPDRPAPLYVSAAASALACLTKGLIGIVLPGLTVLIFLFIAHRRIRWRHFGWAWVIFFVIVLPWHLWMVMHVPGFFERYIVQEHFSRFLGTLKPHDYRQPPFYYNIEHLFLGIFPWTPFLLAALWVRRPYDTLDRFLLVWAAVYVVFFTLSKTSSSYYMLPVLPALALFIGRALPDLQGRLIDGLIGVFVGLCLALGIMSPSIPHPLMRPYVAALAVVYLMFFLSVLPHGARRSVRQLGIAAVGALTATLVLILLYINADPSRYASKDLAMALQPRLTPHAYVFVVDRYEDLSSFDFYLNRPIYVLNPSQGDLYYGIRHFGTPTRLITGPALRALIAHARVFIAGAPSQSSVWRALGHFRVIARNRHDVVVENTRPQTKVRGRALRAPVQSQPSQDAVPHHG